MLVLLRDGRDGVEVEAAPLEAPEWTDMQVDVVLREGGKRRTQASIQPRASSPTLSLVFIPVTPLVVSWSAVRPGPVTVEITRPELA